MVKDLLFETAEEFLDSVKKSEEITETNKAILEKYVNLTLVGKSPKLSQRTISYNLKILNFVLDHTHNDLDKLTIDDIDAFNLAISSWKRKGGYLQGEEISDVTKKQYTIGFRRFIAWYADRYEDQKYERLVKKLKMSVKREPLQSSDLLTKEEINKMISVASNLRDKAIIVTLAESGCRLGELASCTIKSFQPLPDGGCKFTFPEGKTGLRTVVLIRASSYIDHWIRTHPKNDKQDEPLWIALDGKGYRQLDSRTIYGIVQRVARKAEISKRIHPHLFRHTRATQLIKLGWSEPKLKRYIGWADGSNVPGLYIHLGEDDLLEDMYEMHGLIEKRKDDDGVEVGKCPRCFKLIPADEVLCYNCGYVITSNGEQTQSNAITEMISFLQQNPQVLAEALAKAKQ
jgi:integrase